MQSDKKNGPAIVQEIPLAGGIAQGFVVVDSLLGGGGTGGIRAGTDITLDEVAALAREMSFKFAWLNISRGGAKSGICLEPGSSGASAGICREFGAAIGGLLASGQYVAGQDMGIGDAEFREVMRGADLPIDESVADQHIDSNYYTALTTLVAMRTMAEHDGRSLSGLKVLIEGVGKVGRHLLTMLESEGAVLVGVSTVRGAIYREGGIDTGRLLSLAEELGDECVARYDEGEVLPARELYSQPADMLVPGARVNAIDESVAEKLAVRSVVSVANAATTPGAEAILFSRDIRYLPGFVCNSGGIFCWFMASQPPATRRAILDNEFAHKVRNLLHEADRLNISIAELARQQATEKADRMMRAETASLPGRLLLSSGKLAPKRLLYVLLRKLAGKRQADRNIRAVRWYFGSRYLS